MITDSELEFLRDRASEILLRKHRIKSCPTHPDWVKVNDDLTEDLCDQIERLYFKIQYRREKND